MNPPTSKYREHGPYHWRQAENGIRHYSPALDANYRVVTEVIRRMGGAIQRARGSPLTVVDVGCGDGVLLYRLRRTLGSAAKLIGVDCDTVALELCRREFDRARVRAPLLINADATKIPIPDASGDIVTCVELIEHVSDPAKLTEETRRVVREDGIVIFTTPYRRNNGLHSCHHVREFAPSELAETLCPYFEVVEICGFRSTLTSHLYRRAGRPGRLAFKIIARWVYNPMRRCRTLQNGGGAEERQFEQLLAVCRPWS